MDFNISNQKKWKTECLDALSFLIQYLNLAYQYQKKYWIMFQMIFRKILKINKYLRLASMQMKIIDNQIFWLNCFKMIKCIWIDSNKFYQNT